MDEGKAFGIDLLARPPFCFKLRDRGRLLGFFVEVGIVELKENPLGPADVLRVGRVDFP